jgi:tRNA(adenine34) deaminase
VNLDINLKERFMREALLLAQRALDEDEVPVGAVIVHKNRIIAKSYNQTNLLKDPTAHAEMLAITLEPCVMCIGAMIHARIGKLTFGARNVKYGACGSVINVLQDGRWNHEIQVEEGLMRDEAAALLQEFFKKKR